MTLRQGPEGFFRIIAASLVIHAVVIIFGLLVYRGDSKRIFLTPVTVSLVGPEAVSHRGASGPKPTPPAPLKAQAQKQAPTPAKAIVRKEAVSRPRAKANAVKKSDAVFALKKAKDAGAAEDAIRRVKEKVGKEERREELQAAESHIEALKKKSASASKDARRGAADGNRKASSALTAFAKADGAQGAAKNAGAGANDSPSVKYRAYLTAVGDRVKANWTYPEDFKKDKIAVIVSIRIGRSGGLLESWVEKSSGNALFDESLMDAVKKSAPYPPLPQDYEEDVFETGLRFCRNCGE